MKVPFTPLMSSKVKPYAIGLSLASLIFLITQHFLNFPQNMINWEADMELLLTVMLLVGFTGIWGSEEKIEDERVKAIRGHSFYMAFAILSGSMLAYSFTGILNPHSDFLLGPAGIVMFITVANMVYLFAFYLRLYFDPIWVDDKSNLGESVRKNSGFYIIYLSLTGLILIFIALLS